MLKLILDCARLLNIHKVEEVLLNYEEKRHAYAAVWKVKLIVDDATTNIK